MHSGLAAAEAVSYASVSAPDRRRGRLERSSSNLLRETCPWLTLYMSRSPLYSVALFRSRFRVPMGLYRARERKLPAVKPRILQGTDCPGRRGHPLHVKLLNALCSLGHERSLHDLEDRS